MSTNIPSTRNYEFSGKVPREFSVTDHGAAAGMVTVTSPVRRWFRHPRPAILIDGKTNTVVVIFQ